MFEAFSLLLIIAIIFGALYFVFKFSKGIKCGDSNLGIKVLQTVPVNYKISAHILQLGDKYYLCCESCGMLEVEYSSELEAMMKNNSFQSILSKEFGRLNKIKNATNL